MQRSLTKGPITSSILLFALPLMLYIGGRPLSRRRRAGGSGYYLKKKR